MHPALLFLSSFSVVFLLVFQQMNVQMRAFKLASATSVLITLSQVVVFRGLAFGGVVEVAAMAAGGVLGVNASMLTHDKMIRWYKARTAKSEGETLTHKKGI